MGGFRLSATAREVFFWGGSTVLGNRSEPPTAANEGDPIFPYISRLRKDFDNALGLHGWSKGWVARSSLLRNLITEQLHYHHETTGGSWTTVYTPDIEPTDDIWEGALNIHNLKQIISENLIIFPTITEDEINDKSKGDALSKGIALLQLTWFIVQIISRAVRGLAITELELTTAALAGLNSVMYVFWWSKPRDVRFPVVIRTKGVQELLAKRTEDVTWNFPDETFDSRRHLWTPMFKTFAQTFTSLPRTVIDALSSVLTVLKAYPHKISLSFSQLRRYISQIGRAGKDEGWERVRSKGLNIGQNDPIECQELINPESSATSPTFLSSTNVRITVSITNIFNLHCYNVLI